MLSKSKHRVKTNLVDVCEYKTLNFGVSTGQSKDVRTTGQSENVKSMGQLEDVQLADFPSSEEENILHPVHLRLL